MRGACAVTLIVTRFVVKESLIVIESNDRRRKKKLNEIALIPYKIL